MLVLEAALHGFHGGRKFSSVPVAPNLGLVLLKSPVFGLDAIVCDCGFTLCKYLLSLKEFGLLAAQSSLSSSSWPISA